MLLRKLATKKAKIRILYERNTPPQVLAVLTNISLDTLRGYHKRLPSHTGHHPVGRLFARHHGENGPIHRKMVVDCPLVITSKVKLFFRPDKTRKKE